MTLTGLIFFKLSSKDKFKFFEDSSRDVAESSVSLSVSFAYLVIVFTDGDGRRRPTESNFTACEPRFGIKSLQGFQQ